MGAKSPIKLRNRGVAYKCNLCGRSPDALVAHQRTAYNVYTKRRGRPSHTSRPVEPPKSQVKKDVEDENEDQSSPIKASKTRVEFECPKCFKAFPTYFTALKHIQKYHCVNRQNIPVQPHHGNIIQPVRVEVCVKCMEKVKSIKSHICTADSNNTDDGAKLFMCAACEEWFPNLKAFDSHIVTTHGDHIESMFFPTQLEFTKWKTELEQQMNVSYSSIEQYDSKWYYHCDFVKDGRDKGKTNYICPSTIVVQEFTKGIQVHFYHQHHKHCSLEYNLSHKYKKNSISSFMKRTEDYNNLANLKQDENDLYMQFKALMEGIIVDAAKINIATLKVLLGKALEITAILTNYDEELDDISTVALNPKQSISDVEITKLLGESLTKRKAIEASTTNVLDVSLAKRKKNEIPTFTTSIPVGQQILIERNENVDLSSPKIVNSFSLAEGVKSKSTPMNTLTDKSNKELEVETEEEKKSKLNGDDTPSSFNDSYKDFVKNFVNMESVASRTRSKPVLKTLIGQFKPNLMEIDDKPKSLHVPPRVLDDKPKLVVDSNKSAEEKLKLVPRTNKQTYR